MTRISRFPLGEEKTNKLFRLFFEVVGKKDTEEEFMEVVLDLFSPVERIMIAKRVAIVYLLLKKIDHRTICDVLKVSSATVAKFVLLGEKSHGMVSTFKRIINNERVGESLDEIFNTLFAPGVYGVNWKMAWRRKLDLEKRKNEGL